MKHFTAHQRVIIINAIISATCVVCGIGQMHVNSNGHMDAGFPGVMTQYIHQTHSSQILIQT